MAVLLAGLPDNVPGVTVNRLCASGLNAVGAAAQAIRAGDDRFRNRGGVESMTRAPFVQGKAAEPSRARPRSRHHHRLALHQPLMKKHYGARCHAGDRRERRRGVPGHARRTRMHSPGARSSAPGKAIASGYFAEENVRWRFRKGAGEGRGG
jgi:3-oxoadipyl-CoA thiolase